MYSTTIANIIGLLTLSATIGCGTGTDALKSDAQTPPVTGRADIESWLTAGSYKSWKCEQAVHALRSPSPHGMNRICSNTLTSAAGSGEYPVGAAGVKELYDDAGKNIVGYAVYLHTKAGTGGDSWYWYERVPANSQAPHDANGVVADGDGSAGPALSICVGCHKLSGSGAGYSGHDFVFTQVK